MKESVPPRPELRLETTEEADAHIGSTSPHLSREERVRDRQVARAKEAESSRVARDAPILAQFPQNLDIEQQAIVAGTWSPAGSFFGRLLASRGNNIADPVASRAFSEYRGLLDFNDASQREREFEKNVQAELTLAQKGQWNKSDSRIHILHIADKGGDKDYVTKLEQALATLAKTNSDAIGRRLATIERAIKGIEN